MLSVDSLAQCEVHSDQHRQNCAKEREAFQAQLGETPAS